MRKITSTSVLVASLAASTPAEAQIAIPKAFVEVMGEAGAEAAFRNEVGGSQIWGYGDKGIVQGPDQIWKGPRGRVHVVEAKGGSSRLSKAYGFRQGTAEWAIKSSEFVLDSPSSSVPQRESAMSVLEAGAKGDLRVHSYSTKDVFEGTAGTRKIAYDGGSEASQKLAKKTLGRIKAGAAGAPPAAGIAEAAVESGLLTGVVRGAKVVGAVALVVEAGLHVKKGMNLHNQRSQGDLTVQEYEVEQAQNVAGFGGGLAAAAGGAKAGAALGASLGPWGAAGGAITLGTVGYFGGEAAAEAGASYVVEKVHAAGTTVEEVASDAWEGTKQGASWTWGKAKAGAQGVAKGCNWLVEKVSW